MSVTDELLSKYPIISQQVDREDIHHVLCHLEKVIDAHVGGSIVEFGCYIGTTSLFIRRLQTARHDLRPFHVYDSFEGLPPKSEKDASPAGSDFKAGTLAISKKQFIREFQKAGLALPIIHKRWFDDLTASDIPEQIAFAFLDGDFYGSIKSSLQLILPRMTEGAIIVVDDYVREALPGVAKAVHELGLQPLAVHGLGIITIKS